MKKLNFTLPFAGYDQLSFINSFASVYMYLENIAYDDDYVCPQKATGHCNGCGNCKRSSGRIQEDLYFLFDTLSGRSSLRPAFEGEAPDLGSSSETIQFCMGFAGYDFIKVTERFRETLAAEIDAGRPVISLMKDARFGRTRVLIGYDGDQIIMADPKGAQQAPKAAPVYEDIDCMYAVAGTGRAKYSLADGLRNIRRVMSENRDKQIWDDCISRFRYWDNKLPDMPFEHLRAMFKRICDLAWYNFNCHNFAETFRHRVIDELRNPQLDGACRQIDVSYDGAHTRNWQLIGLYECRDWSKRRYHELEWGMCECVVQCLQALKQYDAEVLSAVDDMLAVLSKAEASCHAQP